MLGQDLLLWNLLPRNGLTIWTSSAAMCGDARCMFYKQNLQGVSNDRGDTLLSSEMKYECAHLEAAKKERKTPT
jgi:hypothetical protein